MPPSISTTPDPSTTARRRAPRRPPTRQEQVVRHLEREWRRLGHRSDVIGHLTRATSGDRHLDRWAVAVVRRAAGTDELIALLGRHRGADADRLLHWMLLAGRSERLAHRVAFQRLLPLVVVAASSGRVRAVCPTPFDELIGATAGIIGEYAAPGERPNLAPRLVDRAVHQVVRKPGRRRAATAEVSAVPDDFDRLLAPDSRLDATAATARVLAAGAAAGIEPHLLDVARRLARGESTSDIATVHRCTDRTVRNHRARVCARLSAVLGPSWSDWSDPLTGLEFGGLRVAPT